MISGHLADGTVDESSSSHRPNLGIGRRMTKHGLGRGAGHPVSTVTAAHIADGRHGVSRGADGCCRRASISWRNESTMGRLSAQVCRLIDRRMSHGMPGLVVPDPAARRESGAGPRRSHPRLPRPGGVFVPAAGHRVTAAAAGPHSDVSQPSALTPSRRPVRRLPGPDTTLSMRLGRVWPRFVGPQAG